MSYNDKNSKSRHNYIPVTELQSLQIPSHHFSRKANNAAVVLMPVLLMKMLRLTERASLVRVMGEGYKHISTLHVAEGVGAGPVAPFPEWVQGTR